MSIALRRKMFKLGGRANTHGMGLTSGLKMKKGGSVEPQATFGVGNNMLKKVGPDGKVRDAHFAFLAPAALTAGRIGASLLAPGLRSLVGAARGGGLKSFIGRTGGPAVGPTGPLPFVAPTALQRAGRAGILGVGGLSALSPALFGLSALNTDKDSPRILRGAEAAGELLTDISPLGGLFTLGDFAFGKEGEKARTLTEALGLKDTKEEVKLESKGDTNVAKKDTVAEAKQKTEDRVKELYEKLGGKGVDKLAALGAGLTAAAAPLLEEDYGGAAAAFQQGLQPEIERDRALQDAAAQLAIGEEAEIRAAERERDTLERAADLELLATGDPNVVIRANRLEKAVDELGDAVIALPTKIKNKRATIDVDKLDKNRIYTDLEGIFPQTYVATNSAKIPQAFANVSQAAAYAKS